MGLLDYYRQFDDMDEEEVNRACASGGHGEKALALEHVPVLDLSSTEWPDFPNAEVVNASIYAARGRRERLSGPATRPGARGRWPSATASTRSRS